MNVNRSSAFAILVFLNLAVISCAEEEAESCGGNAYSANDECRCNDGYVRCSEDTSSPDYSNCCGGWCGDNNVWNGEDCVCRSGYDWCSTDEEDPHFWDCCLTEVDDPCGEVNCDDGIACTVDSCADGICSNRADDGLCASDEVCVGGVGCELVDTNDPRRWIDTAVEYPGIIDSFFPTYLSHLIGKTDFLDGDVHLVKLDLTNNSDSLGFDLQIEVSLAGRSAAARTTLHLNPGEIASVGLTPALDLDALFDQTEERAGSIQVSVRSDATVVWENSQPVTVLGRSTFLLREELWDYLAVAVTPHDRDNDVHTWIRNAADLNPLGNMGGYQNGSLSQSGTLDPGYLNTDPVTVADHHQQETIEIRLLTSSGSSGAFIALVDEQNLDCILQDATGCQAICQSSLPAVVNSTLSCGPLDAGSYHALYWNRAQQGQWSYTVARTLTHFEITGLHLGALYYALQDLSFRYVNIPGDFMSSTAQNIQYPTETYSLRGGNCIDGTILFASALESMGMRPYIVLHPGHAYLAVAIWDDDTSPLLALETTMVGQHDFVSALDAGITTFSEDIENNRATLIDIVELRKSGISPAPM